MRKEDLRSFPRRTRSPQWLHLVSLLLDTRSHISEWQKPRPIQVSASGSQRDEQLFARCHSAEFATIDARNRVSASAVRAWLRPRFIPSISKTGSFVIQGRDSAEAPSAHVHTEPASQRRSTRHRCGNAQVKVSRHAETPSAAHFRPSSTPARKRHYSGLSVAFLSRSRKCYPNMR